MKKQAYIFDIDGTLADCSQRLHFIEPADNATFTYDGKLEFNPDWDSFYKDCVNDKPILPVVELAHTLKDAYETLIFVTGRPEKYMEETVNWLCDKLDCNSVILMMRKNGDHRPDYIVKKEIYEEYIKPYHHIDGVFEDRKQCVDMWRSLGLTCYQVADGSY
jgi:phosphoglycolate phosphatase-like HAD superfamily hydrolase